MTGKQRIIADTIVTVICKEFRVFSENTIVRHTAALILSETYFTLEETAEIMSTDKEDAWEKITIANNVFWESREFRKIIYRIITKIHLELSFSASQRSRKIYSSDLPGIEAINEAIIYQQRRRKHKN